MPSTSQHYPACSTLPHGSTTTVNESRASVIHKPCYASLDGESTFCTRCLLRTPTTRHRLPSPTSNRPLECTWLHSSSQLGLRWGYLRRSRAEPLSDWSSSPAVAALGSTVLIGTRTGKTTVV